MDGRLARLRSSAPVSVCKVSAANEHTRVSQAIGRAEQRSAGRIRAGACLSVASLRPTPDGVSSARYPVGARPLARLSFAYFSLAKQRKVWPAAGASRPAGPNRYLQTSLSFAHLFFGQAKKSMARIRCTPATKPLPVAPFLKKIFHPVPLLVPFSACQRPTTLRLEQP